MKRLLSFCLLLVLLLTLSGCKLAFIGRTEMSRIEFIRAVGIDMISDKENTVRLTIATQSVQSGGGGGGVQKKSEVLFSEGKTVFEAIRNFWNFMDKRPFWGHLEYIVIGEEAARDGLLKYIDFFSRDPEVRLNAKVYVARGLKAEMVIKKGNTPDKFVFDRLEGLGENIWGQSISNKVDLMEIMYILDNPFLSLYIPCVELDKFSESQQSENDGLDIILGGFAIFKGDKLVNHLNSKMGLGLNWLRNKIKSGVIIVKSPKGENISLEIIQSSTKLKPKIVDDKLSMIIEVKMTSHVNEIRSSENIFTDKALEALEKEEQQVIKKEIESTIEFAQSHGLDFFGTAAEVFRKYPIKWEDNFEKNWEEIFPNMNFDVKVTSVIPRTYNIKEPTRAKAGDEL